MPSFARRRPLLHILRSVVIVAAAIAWPPIAAAPAQEGAAPAAGTNGTTSDVAPAAPAPPSAAEPPPPQAAPPQAAPPQAAPQPAPPAAAKVIDRTEIQGVLGRQVLSRTGDDMGRIVEVIVDRSGGHPRAVIIDFGGFLGVGVRKIAVDWNVLQFSSEQGSERVTLDLTRDQVKAAPEYKEGRPLVVLTRAPAAEPAPTPTPIPTPE